MKNLPTFLLLTAMFIGCSHEEGHWLYLRLSHASSYNFENIVVNTSYGHVAYDDLDSGESTKYKAFEIAYSYAFIELTIDGEIYRFQPEDYVGETPLKWGKYTYQINLTDTQKEYYELGLELIEN
jgi:hypothetical protein